jgi:hypothetical protein
MALSSFLVPWLVLWATGAILPWVLASRLSRNVCALALPSLAVALLLWQREASAVQRLFASSVFLLFAMKAAVLLKSDRNKSRRLGMVSLALFFTAWPGMEAERLIPDRESKESGTAKLFDSSIVRFYAGLVAIFFTAYFAPQMGSEWTGWCGIIALLLTIHFGLSGVLTVLVRLTNRPAEVLFDAPEKSMSALEFWSKRWNRPFIAMDRKLFMPSLTKLLGLRGAVFATFLISGLLHELAISYPAGGGYGLPLLYFVIQGALAFLERRLRLKSRAFTWFGVLAPLPLLFHQRFRDRLIVPFFQWMHDALVSHTLEWYYARGLWIMGFLQLAVLLASFQVPKALDWKEDLSKLNPFNRKLMWVYGSFIVFTIIGFGTMTLLLRNSFLRGDTAAVVLAGFISVFWVLRVLTDFFYFDKNDWPKGVLYEVGRSMLNSLFFFLILSYGGIVAWHFDSLR